MPRWLRRAAVILVIVGTIVPISQLRADAPGTAPAAIVRVFDELTVDAVGNVSGKSEIVLPEEFYRKFKTLMSPRQYVQENGRTAVKLREPSINNVLRFLGVTSNSFEVPEVTGNFDDDAATIHVQYRILGRAGYRHDRWELPLGNDPELNIEFRKVELRSDSCFIEARARQQGMQWISRIKVNLPAGAHDVEFQKKSLELVYEAPAPALAADMKAGRPEFRFEPKPQLMSALYKLYGNPKWSELFAARSVFQNHTPETLTDFRTRFRIEGYANWGPWHKCDKVFPGQTVVHAFHPLIDSRITQLKGRTPALVEVEYEYARPDGEKVAESESSRISLLGMNEAIWSSLELNENSTWYDLFRNAPLLLSSFTSATDPVVQDVVGMISKATGGRGAALSDEDALKFLGTLYNLLRTNIAYETTPGSVQDGLLHQHLKYGRDVLRTRSGTCVNLAILYASVSEAAGLDAYIIVGPGHAFAGVKLPKSGMPVVIETTGCRGGTKENSDTFVQARESAYRTYQQWMADGLMIEVDIASARKQGVPSPELPEAGSNPLREWGIQAPEEAKEVDMPLLLVTVKQSLEAMQIRYRPIKDKTALAIDCNDPQAGPWLTIAQTFETAQLMVFMSQVPDTVPEPQRASVGAVLAQVNSAMIHGGFELSKEGRIVYRTSTNLRGGLLNPMVAQSEMSWHIEVMKKHLPDLKRLTTAAPAAEQAKTQAQRAKTNGSAADDGPSIRPAQSTSAAQAFVGTWKATIVDENGQQYMQLSKLLPDGRYAAVVSAVGTGQTMEITGTWKYADGVITCVRSTGVTTAGTVRWVNRNRFVFTSNGYETTYDRVE